jgi:hypothetical protein
MIRARKTFHFAAMLAVGLVVGAAWAAMGTQATVLTNLGGVADGTLTGLGPLIQLRAPDEVSVIGPMQQYNIPVSSIRQISVDFPRVIIETEAGVIIGPYSAFAGMDELLTLGVTSGSVSIPFTSVRAIALHGNALQAVPREWMGDRFLSTPEILAASPLAAETCADCAITTTPPSTTADTEVVWEAITPMVEEEPSGEIPWWIGLLAVGLLVVVMFALGSGS